MPREIELKLGLPPGQTRRLRTHPALAGCAMQTHRLQNTYYDTDDRALRERGIALRLRRKDGSIWLMTVKGGDAGAGGLAARAEWEAPTRPGHFVFDIVTDAELRDFLHSVEARLKPVFATDFTRTAWLVDRAGVRIEAALDRGTIRALQKKDAASGRLPICELELELIEGGSPDDLFGLALALCADIDLHPEVRSKAERGYAQAEATAACPAKALPSALASAMSPTEAFRSIAAACLLQLQRNEGGAVTGGDPEFIHQSRVAIRRLRSAIRLFSPALLPGFVAVYAPRWRDLSQQLGSARDWDVFLSDTLAPLEMAFPGDADLAVLRARGEANKTRAQDAARAALSGRDYSRLLLAFVAALFREEAPTIDAQNEAARRALPSFAARRLDRRLAAIRRVLGNPDDMDDARRHRLRIQFKRLRYALEFFAPLLHAKRLSSYLGVVGEIQSLLGTLNDQVTASRFIREMRPQGKPDPLIQGWIAGRAELQLRLLDDAIEVFRDHRPPWR